ncbi:radical SAM protein [bacterium]|nr:radical SAM protein [candidate division CSSED10-310 bacterium]
MRVFLGNPPWSEPGLYGVRAGSRWPHLENAADRYMPFPFFLAYACAVLEKNGYFPRMVDGIAERLTPAAFLYALEEAAPDLIVLEVSTPSFPYDLETVTTIRNRMGKDVKIALCGANHLMTGRDFLENRTDVDYIFRGEFEYILLELVQALESGKSLDSISGLNFRDNMGNPVVNPARPLLRDIDSIPWPSRHQLPMKSYYDEAGSVVEPGVQMWASRGCPHMCIFCVWPQLVYGGPSYRVRNPVDVVDEMAWLVETYGFRSIYFDDDTFNIGKQRMVTLCREIERRKLCVPWSIMARADGMDRDLLESMKAAGLASVKYGVESGDQGIVDASGKKLDLSEAREVINITRSLGIRYHLTFTFGLPGETRETAQKTIDFALEMDPDTIQFSICTPMPGSRYFEMAREKGYLMDVDWTKYTGFTSAVIRTDALSASDLEEILDTANTAWYRHIQRRVRRQRTMKQKTANYLHRSCHAAIRKLFGNVV